MIRICEEAVRKFNASQRKQDIPSLKKTFQKVALDIWGTTDDEAKLQRTEHLSTLAKDSIYKATYEYQQATDLSVKNDR
jgi:hypothetical protein